MSSATRRNSLSRAKVRTRRDSGTKLDYYYKIVQKTILQYQSPVTGLFSKENDHAWVRDNVYAILAVWALALAYKKHADKDYGRAKAYELEQSVVKLMRALLTCMMLQVHKVEKFKYTLDIKDSLHAKYSAKTCETVVGDCEWGHLQIDATSLFLLMLAEMTASGLQIIFNLDEVSFIQNLVFYIERAYSTPDYGIWERGDKTNHGRPELNSSSIGMAKAALEALDEFDLFGSRGGYSSVIHVLPDTIHWCNIILQCMLPRESNSKETDAALLSIISYPAFSLDDLQLINLTRNDILNKLQGRYGCCRFIRDGYKTSKEDPRRLYYEPWELKVFENIECEWPLFWCYLVLDGIFYSNDEQVEVISSNLENVLLKDEDQIKLVPELYAVPSYKVDDEYKSPKSQDRVPLGKLPHLWGQSLYIIGKLLKDNLIAIGELDPLNKRLVMQPKPDLVVQVCVLAENENIKKSLLESHNISCVQSIDELLPTIQIYPSKALAYIYSFLGKNTKLGLTGRPVTDIGYLAISKLYTFRGQTIAFTPPFMDRKSYYMGSDIDYALDLFRTYVAFIEKNWNNIPGRPTVIFLITKELYEAHRTLNSALISTIRKLYSGYINEARVQLGKLDDFLTTSCITSLTFLESEANSCDIMDSLNKFRESETIDYKTIKGVDAFSNINSSFTSGCGGGGSGGHKFKKFGIIKGIAKRSRSITYDTCPLLKEDLTINLKETISEERRMRVDLSTHYDKMNFDGVINLLKDTKSLLDEADILHFLYETKGLDFDTKLPGHNVTTVRGLISELYEKASLRKMWWLVRHTAGMLSLKPDNLEKSVLTLVVRQKQVSVGIPTAQKNREINITKPLMVDQIFDILKQAWDKDISMIMVTQELLVYLALFIATEPQLFQGMIRLRTGLIIQVMIGELQRTLNCSVEDATDHLLNLSPFEMKTLLHMIIIGKELDATSIYSSKEETEQNKAELERRYLRDEIKQGLSVRNKPIILNEFHDEQNQNDNDKHGQWIRRRRLDGSLNRVPIGFYSKVWLSLEKCLGIQIYGYTLSQSLTREMTMEELKFALLVEEALNRIPEPEYRQIIVEACMLLTLLAQNESKFYVNQIVVIDNIVENANKLFLDEQLKVNGDATNCCATSNTTKKCSGACNICECFYDLAPSGRYGSMNYIFRAMSKLLLQNPECNIS